MPIQRLPLSASIREREAGEAKDPLLKNCYRETVGEASEPTKSAQEHGSGDTIYVTKRPGLKSYDDLSAATTDTGRGVVNWEGRVYSLIGDELFNDETDIGQVNTSSGRVHFDVGIDENADNVLCFHDGTTFYAVTDENAIQEFNNGGTSGATAVAGMPTAMVPGLVILNQYAFIMDSLGNIYNSAVGDVPNFGGDSLNMEIQLDAGITLRRYINYIVGFGENTTEFFYDAANATGSPLNRFEGMAALVGCASANTATNCDKALLWVAKSPEGGRFVAILDGGFEHQRISTNAIDEVLDKEGSNISNAYAYHIRTAGKNLYVLTLPTTAARTFVYDLDEKEWDEWTSDVSGTEGIFQAMDSTEKDGTLVLLDDSNGLLYDLDAETYQDQTGSNETVKVELRTKRHDMDTMQTKFMYRCQAIGDLNASTGTINIAWSDDDYQTWSTDRTQDLDNHESWLTRLGSFKRRAFRIQHEQNFPMRLSHLEVFGETGHYSRTS